MKKLIPVLLLIVSGFAGGAFAQTIGGGLLAQTVVPTFINYLQQASGTTTGSYGTINPQMPLNSIRINPDNVDGSGGGSNGIVGFNTELDVNGSSAKGNRAAGQFITRVQQVAAGQTGGALNFNGLGSVGQIDVNVGGTDTTVANSRGAVFGFGAVAISSAGATNLLNVTGMEVDVKAVAGSSMGHKSGISIATIAGDGVRGSNYDSALSIGAISNVAGANGWLHGILFSDYNGNQPMNSAGTLLATQGAATTTNGIDFTSYTFTGSPMLMPLMTPATSGAACVTGAIEWDTGFIYICTATNTWKRATLASF
jgi:hypothetical protein